MSIQPELPRSMVRRQLGLSYKAFVRWCNAAKVPPKAFYKDYEVGLLVEVGNYLSEDRSLERAAKHIDELLGA